MAGLGLKFFKIILTWNHGLVTTFVRFKFGACDQETVLLK